jgi:hypothetical protein
MLGLGGELLSKVRAEPFLKLIRVVLVFLCLSLLGLTTGCHRGGGTIRNGALKYNATEIFGDGTVELKLAEAAGRGDKKEIKHLVATGAKVNFVGKHEITPLFWAAWAGNFKGFEMLLGEGADPNAQRAEGYPIMHLVAQTSDIRFLECALKHGGDPNLIDKSTKKPPLFFVVMMGAIPQIEMLLNAGANVNAQTLDGSTLPIYAMSSPPKYKLVYLLLQRGADPHLQTINHSGLADFIERSSRTETTMWNDSWRVKVIDCLKTNGIQVTDLNTNY